MSLVASLLGAECMCEIPDTTIPLGCLAAQRVHTCMLATRLVYMCVYLRVAASRGTHVCVCVMSCCILQAYIGWGGDGARAATTFLINKIPSHLLPLTEPRHGQGSDSKPGIRGLGSGTNGERQGSNGNSLRLFLTGCCQICVDYVFAKWRWRGFVNWKNVAKRFDQYFAKLDLNFTRNRLFWGSFGASKLLTRCWAKFKLFCQYRRTSNRLYDAAAFVQTLYQT